MTSEPPKGPSDFDADDWATFKDMLIDYRRRQAVRDTAATWAKWLGLGFGALLALSYFRDFIQVLLEKKGGR